MELSQTQTTTHIRHLLAEAHKAQAQHCPPPVAGESSPGTGSFIAALNRANQSLYERLHAQAAEATRIATEQRQVLGQIIDHDHALGHQLDKAMPQ
ncbi:hypothetical protein [Corynebacterium pelargi]|uniref:Uncharacterized protein n=1 Tax=Corynebacterium pelargi TaxID=1471400 RepID=A0A410WAH0_9CORY|nr:hypothetical protein [Corynebacterium pelargi]QAU52973.1 hypothetical protein CPELA_08590 [Corynebacterium pelargi]GGG75646.1 hypothetical protein GCM10007338_11610 [Corynebacterium pelargi]